MDARHFDSLVRGFGNSAWTRRGLARLLTATALAPFLGGSAPEASAKRRGGKHKKKCKNGTVKCGKACVDMQTDEDHCGGCGDACEPGETCGGGQCNPSGCGAGQLNCGGGLCIPDGELACCAQADCGPTNGNDLRCNLSTHRCECGFADEGICELFGNGNGGRCGRCCLGGVRNIGDQCLGPNDELICIDRTEDGCRCPAGRPFTCTSVDDRGLKCTADTRSDAHACGADCRNCGSHRACCNGNCTFACAPGFFSTSCFRQPCGDSCTPCPEEAPLCCAYGGLPRCVLPSGLVCPSVAP